MRRKPNALMSVNVGTGVRERWKMTAFQGFLLGLTVAWLPSLVFLGCIALGAAAQDHSGQPNLRAYPRQLSA
jgi:hypothetical protein